MITKKIIVVCQKRLKQRLIASYKRIVELFKYPVCFKTHAC